MNKKKINIKKKILLIITLIISIITLIYFLYIPICNAFDKSLRSMGFILDDIYITENGPIPRNYSIDAYINIKRGDSIFKTSSRSIYNSISNNPWINNIIVHKGFPNKICINVTYKKALAILQENMTFKLIDEKGKKIIEIDKKEIRKTLPIVVGEESAEKVSIFLKTLEKYPNIKNKLNSMSYIRKRRWNIIVCGGITVKLPEEKIETALEKLEILLKQPNINKKTVKIIDMRVKDNIIFSGSQLVVDKTLQIH